MAKTIREVKDTVEEGLTITVPESFYEKPFVRRMLDPASSTIEVDGEEASVRTMTMDGKLFPTIVPIEQADGSSTLIQLEPKVAYDLAMDTGNFIQFDSDAEADQQSQILSNEAYNLRQAYKNNQNFLSQGGKGLGDLEFRADMEPYAGDDILNRLGLELFRRGEIELKGITQDQGERPGGGILGGYAGKDFSRLDDVLKRDVRDQNPLTKEKIMSSPSLATYIAGVSKESDTTFDRPRGESELSAMHELRHGALRYLFNNTDLQKQKYFDNFDIDVEEDIMDITDNKTIKDLNIPTTIDKVSKLNPKYIGREDRFDTINQYAAKALEDFNVPKRTKQKEPGILKKLFGMEQGGIMMAQQGKMPLPMEEAQSAPQGGGPKAANAAAKPESLGAPTGGSAPAGSSDPRDAAIKEVAQKMQKRSTPPPAPAPQMVPPPAGLGTPMEEIPMMAKGGMADDGGMSVMIGLGSPSADYEEAAEGNPPPGATKEEVADDQLVLLSEGELVVPANVVRFHGLGAYEGMRREALMGLQDMETNGQIEYVSGGADKADKVDDDGGIIKANQGTYLGTRGTYVAPQAASAKYVTVPNKSLGMSTQNQTQPLARTGFFPGPYPGIPGIGGPYTPTTTASSLYAPNVGAYKNPNDGGNDPEDGTPDEPGDSQAPIIPKQREEGDGGDSPPSGASTVFGGESVNGLLQGGKNYGIEYTSSSTTPGMGTLNVLSNLMNLDQVTITDPITGRKATMSTAKYNEMKEDRTNSANVDYIDSLMDLQAGIDYNRARATDIAPLQTGLAVAAENFGFGKAPGTSTFDQNAYAKSLAEDFGIEYVGQSMPEVMMQGNMTATKTSLGQPLSPVQNRQFDVMGNPITDGRYAGQVSTQQGLAAPEVAYGAGQFSGTPAQPVAVNSFAGPYTQPTLSPTTEAGRLAQFAAPTMDTSAVAMSMPNQMGIGAPTTEAGRLASFTAPTGNTVAYTPNEAARLTSFAAPTRDTSAVAMSMPNQMGIGDPATEAGRLAQFAAPTTDTSAVARQTDDIFSTPAMSSPRASERRGERAAYQDNFSNDIFSTPAMSSVNDPGTRASERRGERASYQASLFDDDFEAPDNQGANMDDDAPSASRDMSTNEGRKAAADEEAQAQTGNPNSSAVTDSSGNAVRSTDGSVVTDDPPGNNNSGGDDGCFAKGTLISMADGTTKPVEDVDISDEVKLGGFVFATGKFLINNLYEYKGIQVSGSHMVFEDGKWLRVEDSELSKLITKDDTIVYVFGSENRRIVIDDVVFTDYFEVNEQEKLKQVGDFYFTNWKKDAKITSKSNLEVRNKANANATTLAA